MNAAELIRRREGDWRRLNALSAPGTLPLAEMSEFARLYRRCLLDLAQLRTVEAGKETETVVWLNALAARAHGIVYRDAARSKSPIGDFYLRDLPAALRRAKFRTGLAAAVMIAAAIIAGAIALHDVALARLLAGATGSANAEQFAQLGTGRDSAQSAVMNAFYISNNTRVAFLSFASGITFGLGPLYLMIMNGYSLGLTVALVFHYGHPQNLLAFIAPHAPLELFGIFIAAAAGLQVGHALIAPGPHLRTVALRRAALEASKLALGAATLMVLAAFFEAFVSPSSLPPSAKFAIGAFNALWLTAYVVTVGRCSSTASCR